MMKALVLNLESETQRMAFQMEQLQSLGLPFERIAARTPADLSPPSNDPFWKRWERPLKEVEKAILLTHRDAWLQIIEDASPTLILEDDAWLSPKTSAFLKSIETTKGLEHVTLEVRGRKKIISKKPHEQIKTLHRLYQDRSGAAAYVLWPEGAQKLIARSDRCAGLADAMICAAYEMSSWQAVPPLAVQLDQCERYGLTPPLQTRSSVLQGAESNGNPSKDLGFLIRRLSGQVRMGVRQLTTVLKAHKVSLKPDFPTIDS